MIYRDFTVLCDSLFINDSVILIGHSKGGMLVRYFTTQNPDLIDRRLRN